MIGRREVHPMGVHELRRRLTARSVIGPCYDSLLFCSIGAKKFFVWKYPDTPKIQTVGIPAGRDRDIALGETGGVKLAGNF